MEAFLELEEKGLHITNQRGLLASSSCRLNGVRLQSGMSQYPLYLKDAFLISLPQEPASRGTAVLRSLRGATTYSINAADVGSSLMDGMGSMKGIHSTTPNGTIGEVWLLTPATAFSIT
ncbi:hypothetical protein NPIL_148901 [Nephila pilipes]|uniref:Uncharacterized protein n=1 Tax=Nephila pilipes TaxID=299642 RepID=A0A8X6U5M6_NEPPI|nr:hypothetical protein NPIL_148901 [Nephila pilipes]